MTNSTSNLALGEKEKRTFHSHTFKCKININKEKLIVTRCVVVFNLELIK